MIVPSIIGKNKRMKTASCQFKVNMVTAVTTKINIELKKLEKMLLNISATACVSLVKRETIAPAGV